MKTAECEAISPGQDAGSRPCFLLCAAWSTVLKVLSGTVLGDCAAQQCAKTEEGAEGLVGGDLSRNASSQVECHSQQALVLTSSKPRARRSDYRSGHSLRATKVRTE